MLDMFGHLIFPTKHGGLAPLHDLYTNQKFHPSVASLVAAHSPRKVRLHCSVHFKYFAQFPVYGFLSAVVFYRDSAGHVVYIC